MASIVGHACGGLLTRRILGARLARKKERLLLALFASLALAPDLDIVVYLLLRPLGMTPHRGITHGLPFALIAGGAVALLATRYFGVTKTRLFVASTCSVLSHAALDFLMGAGPPVPLFAPFSDIGFLSPVTLIPWSYYGKTAEGLLGVLIYPPAILGVCLELLIFIPLLVVTRDERPPRQRTLLLLASALAVFCTALMYN